MQFIVLRVFLPNEFASADECENAVVPLTQELAQTILARRKLLLETKGKDKELYEATFWSRQECQFFTMGHIESEIALTEEEQSDYACEDWVIIEREKEINSELALRMEMIMMHLHEDHMYWRAMPKHEDIHIETAPINYKNFEEALSGDD